MEVSGCSLSRVVQLVMVLTGLVGSVDGGVQLPGLSPQCYAQPGDVVIGSILRITKPDQSAPDQCAPIIKNSYILQYVEAIVYAVEMINNRSDILPNITLGYIILDTCTIYPMVLGQSVNFIPTDDMVEGTETPKCINGTTLQHYDVIASIGTSSSYYTIPTALAMSSAEKPLMGTTETSDELSDPGRFEYFVPLALSDKYQALVILQLLSHYNWTYFVLLYEEGTYGENGGKELQKNAGTYDICLEHSIMLYIDLDDSHVAGVMELLEYYTISKVVVLFTSTSTTGTFFNALPEHLYNKFVWIGSDGTGYTTYGAPANGLINVNLQLETEQDFKDYYRRITPVTTNNPWWSLLWEEIYDCTWQTSGDSSVASNITSCTEYENSSVSADQVVDGVPGSYIDAVTILAEALHVHLSTLCPDVFYGSDSLRDCIQGPDYLRVIQQMVSGDDRSAQSRYSGYVLKQYTSNGDSTHIVGYWDTTTGLRLLQEQIEWYYVDDDDETVIPDSACSLPCQPKQYIIYKAVECCWECRYCLINEIVVENGTACKSCETNTWPDPETATVCLDIAPVYLTWSIDTGVTLFSLILIGILLALAVAALFIFHRDKRLIKASSKDLMSIILIGVMLAFLGAFVNIFEPSAVTCLLRDLGFGMSVTVIYAPLLLKTVRVYRIFAAGRSGNKNLRWISARSQLVLTALLLGLQLILIIVVNMLEPSTAVITMPVFTEEYTELSCSLPPEVLTVLLSFNLILLITCAVFGFLTRKLPENFNESWFIFVSVATTTFIWIVFLPTYFTAFHAYHKTILLTSCLLLNGYITLTCLFAPKIYAVIWVEESKMKYLAQPSSQTNASTAQDQ